MQSLRLIAALWALFLLTACGGGGEVSRETPTTTPTTPTVSIALTISNQANETDRNLALDNPLTITATVSDSSGSPVADQLITFTVAQSDLLVFGNDTGTARTNDEGIATIGITVGTASGDGEITATLNSGESATTTFSSAGSSSSNSQPAEIALYSSSLQLPSGGADEIELIALVKDSQSVLLEGIDVSFSVSSDANVELQLLQPTTAADGTARAILTTQNNAGNREFQVTARAGSFVSTVDIEVLGTEIVVNGSSSLVLNDSSDFIIRVQDSDGVALPNQEITLTTTGGQLSAASVTSGPDGQATISYIATVSGEQTISAESAALNASSEITVTVQQDVFRFNEAYDADIPLDTPTQIAVTWSKDGTPYSNGNVTFSASRGTITSSPTTTTDANGVATFTITSSNAGIASITATGTDANNAQVSARLNIEFIATQPDRIFADASPELIGPEGQTSTITALVRDANGNLVKGAVVTFNVDDNSAGSISPSQATTDSNGVAATVFTSGSVTTLESINITAEILNMPSVSDSVTLSVGNRPFDISMGTGNIISSPDNSTYLKEFAIFVTDAAGRPVSGVDLTASLSPQKSPGDHTLNGPVAFRKGSWLWDEDIWRIGYRVEDPDNPGTYLFFYEYTATCSNEDLDNDGVLDMTPQNEDRDGDNFLTPGIIGSLSFQGSSTTDVNGQATLELRYPREYGAFYVGIITVYGQSSGSESRASMRYDYGVAGEDLDDEAAPPPNSPFGTGTSCYNTN
ncbi:invasin [Alteromonas lipolytica]|uniref:Invasin n=2 Tax=Alteromonas lipolytica TaxID=1856405 RepID=A0A1E8FJG0_9ALTE|nr:invasin [Alteromonas lipolytica]